MYSTSNPPLELSKISTRIVNRMINKLVVVLDETEHGLNNEYAFIYSDIVVKISQLTSVKIQNKNHSEITQITIYK